MRVLITVNTYSPLKDGVQAVTQYHAEGLVKLGHKVTVVTPTNSKANSIDEYINGVRVIRYDVYTKHAFHFGDKKGYRRIIKDLVKDMDVMINVCLQCVTTDLLFPILQEIECKKILYMHGMHEFKWHKERIHGIKSFGHKIYNNFRWKFYYLNIKKYIKLYDEIIQLHEFDYANIYFRRTFGLKSHILGNASDDDFFEDSKHNLILPKEYFICVSNYFENKNQEFLINAFYKSKLHEDVELILIGSEKTVYYEYLIKYKNKLEKKYGKRKIKVLTEISREHIYEYVKNAKICLMSSKQEVFPITIIESMATGTPFITTNVGCVKYLPGGVIINTIEEMSYWIELMYNNNDLIEYYGGAAKKYAVNNFMKAKKIEQLESIIEGLLI